MTKTKQKSESIHILGTDPIKNFLDYYGVIHRNGCWIPTKNIPKDPKKPLRDLMTKLAIIPSAKLSLCLRRKHFCHEPLCLNPYHYQVFSRRTKKLSDADLFDLIEELDLEMCEDLGLDVYLATLNEGFPRSMWIEKKTLESAVKLKRKQLSK